MDNGRGLCSEVLSRFGKNLAYSRIWAETLWTEVGSANSSATRTLLWPYWVAVHVHWRERWYTKYKPSHEIMVLFVLCKLILQTRMRSHPVGLDVWSLVRPFGYFHTSCVRTPKRLWWDCADMYIFLYLQLTERKMHASTRNLRLYTIWCSIN